MHRLTKLCCLPLVVTALLFSSELFPQGDPEPLKGHPPFSESDKYSLCRQTKDGSVIDWKDGLKLNYTNFKAVSKGSSGFAIATTSSAFGYSITNNSGEISGSIYVRFYCDESWWNPGYRLEEVLEHEQLHFDICELFGRKLFKEVLDLRNARKLNKRTIQRLHSKLEKQYANYQDLYDKQTDHSTNGVAQRKWNEKIYRELNELSDYTDYHDF